MIPLCLVAGWIASSSAEVLASVPQDDVTIMLAVKSFTYTESENEVQHQAAAEVRAEVLGMVSADIQELDHFFQAGVSPPNQTSRAIHGRAKTTPFNQTIPELIIEPHQEGHRPLSGQQAAFVTAAAAFLLVCCWGACCRPKGRRKGGYVDYADDEDAIVEVWEKRSTQPPEERIIALFKELDEIEQSDTSPPGYITKDDMYTAFNDARVARELAQLGISQEYCAAAFRMLDGDSDGLVTIEDFVHGCLHAQKALSY